MSKLVSVTEYKGNPVIAIKRNEEDTFPFTFGLGKARLIVEHFEEIKKFVKSVEAKNGNGKK